MKQCTQKERFDYFLKQATLDNNKMFFAGTLLQRASQRYGTSTALICQETTITYKELYYRAYQITVQLKKLGIMPHDKVCLLFENSIHYFYAYYGIWQCGAVVVPLNVYLVTYELQHIVHDAQPKIIIVSDLLASRLDELVDANKPIILQESDFACSGSVPEQIPLLEIPLIDDNNLAALLYTSGTTGMPKGVMLSSRNIITNVIQIIARLSIDKNDRVYGVLPFFHSFAQNSCLWSSIFLGVTVIIIPRIERRYLLEGLQHKPTIVIGVPTLYGLFCLMKKVSFEHVRYFLCGGDSLPDKIRIAFESLYQRRLCNGYGLTETAPFIAIDIDDSIKCINTVGKPAFGIECSLRDDKGNEVAPSEIGILWVKGANIMMGYYNADEEQKKVIKNNWFDTGDLAAWSSQGDLQIVGRYKDLIISKGFNIYPAEIENIIVRYPGITKAAVIGKKDDTLGEVAIAFVASKDEKDQLKKDLHDFCVQHLAGYKVPHEFIIVDDLPLTALGKIDKKKLKSFLLGRNEK